MQIIVNDNGQIAAVHGDGQDLAGLYPGKTLYRAPDSTPVGPDSVFGELGNEAEREEWLAAGARLRRDRLLAASDPMALPDYPHADEAARQAWLDYRAALRDVPAQAGFPGGVPLPTPPVG